MHVVATEWTQIYANTSAKKYWVPTGNSKIVHFVRKRRGGQICSSQLTTKAAKTAPWFIIFFILAMNFVVSTPSGFFQRRTDGSCAMRAETERWSRKFALGFLCWLSLHLRRAWRGGYYPSIPSIPVSYGRQAKLSRVGSRLYRSRFLQVNTRLKALADIYTTNTLVQISGLKCSTRDCF